MCKNTYLYHMIKTGGRSMISSYCHYLMPNYQQCDHNKGYCQLYRELCGEMKVLDDECKLLRKIQRWKYKLKGNYIFGFSHEPHHKTRISNGYTITCLRDPLNRLISHYKMLLYQTSNIHSREESDNSKYVKNGPIKFINTFPIEYSNHQLRFWSRNGNIYEAFQNITKCTQIILTHKIQEGLDKFKKKTDIQLIEQKVGLGSQKHHNLEPTHLEIFKNHLKNEYEFYNMVIDFYNES